MVITYYVRVCSLESPDGKVLGVDGKSDAGTSGVRTLNEQTTQKGEQRRQEQEVRTLHNTHTHTSFATKITLQCASI